MGFTIRFIILFLGTLVVVSPVLIFLVSVILIAAFQVKKLEKWTTFTTIYFAFVTATTVGYGDYRPKSKKARVLSIIIALTGLVATGIMVSSAMMSVTKAFEFTESGHTFGAVFRFIFDLTR